MYTLRRQLLCDVMFPRLSIRTFTYFPSRSSDGTYLLASTELVLIHCDRDSSKADLKKIADQMSCRQVRHTYCKFS
jgi:hypothetical protein